ncbi:MAG: hypothetical protein AB1515_07950 [Nitrospirota bacterium]
MSSESTCSVRAVLKRLNMYAEDLLAPISTARRQCERCGRRLLKGYLVEAPTKVAGMSDLQVLCWRCARPTWLTWARRRGEKPGQGIAEKIIDTHKKGLGKATS